MSDSIITILYGYLQFRGFKADIIEATVTLTTDVQALREQEGPLDDVPVMVTQQEYKVVGVAWAPKGMTVDKHIGKPVTFVGIRGEEKIIIREPLESIGVDYVRPDQSDRALNNNKIRFELQTGLIRPSGDSNFSVVRQS